jgi:hypothetical protein
MIQFSYLLGQITESLLIEDNNLVLGAKAGEEIKFQQGIVLDRLKIMMDIIIQAVRILMVSSTNKILAIFSIFMLAQELKNQN